MKALILTASLGVPVLEILTELQKEGIGNYTIAPVGRNYAFIAHFKSV